MIKTNNKIKNVVAENNSCCCIKRVLCIEEQIRNIDDKIQAIVKCLIQKPLKSCFGELNKPTKLNEKFQEGRYNANVPESDRGQQNKRFYERSQGMESQSDSFLLEDLQFIERSKIQRLKEMGKLINIGQQLETLNKKIETLSEQVIVIPKMKSNISMQTKILEYLEEKTEKIRKQLPKSTQKINLVQPEKYAYGKREQSISLDSLCFSEESQIREVEMNENILNKNI